MNGHRMAQAFRRAIGHTWPHRQKKPGLSGRCADDATATDVHESLPSVSENDVGSCAAATVGHTEPAQAVETCVPDRGSSGETTG